MTLKMFVMFLITAVCVICLMIPATAEVINIPDANLQAAINKTFNKPSAAAITEAELLRLTALDAAEADISELTGLEHARHLTELKLLNNSVSDISALSNLKNLTVLWLAGNDLTDVSQLAHLTRLESLDLSENEISDISSVANLTNLTVPVSWKKRGFRTCRRSLSLKKN